MSDAMTVSYAENAPEKVVRDMRRASSFAIAHVAKRANEDLTGTLNIIHCLSEDCLTMMLPQLELLSEMVSNELRRRA